VFASRADELKDDINVLVLGARSESSLPALWWQEALVAASPVVGKALHISLMGPGLLAKPQQQAAEFKHGGKSLTVRHVEGGACLFHEHPAHMKLLLQTDLFVLFNPGFGSTQALQTSWMPTLHLLLMCRKPILATAHSAWDLKRDLAQLEKITNDTDEQDLGEPLEFLIPPHHSPFASTKRTHDAKEDQEAQIVTTNEFCYAFAAK